MTLSSGQYCEPLESGPAPPSRRVQHLLSVARAQFVERGFDAVSIDAIARSAGVSKETIYRYFPDKEMLFRAALHEVAEEFTARALVVHGTALTAVSELAGLARAILDSALDKGLFSTLWVAVGVSHRMPDLASSLRDGQWQRLEPVREALAHFASDLGMEGQVEIELALDFGALAVGGPALLMGFPAPDDEARTRSSERTADLFARGIGRRLAKGSAPLGAAALSSAAAPQPHLQTLLNEAARHFLAFGYDSANLHAIGAQAKVGRGTLYRHYGSKSGLFSEAMRRAASEVAQAARFTPQEVPATDRKALIGFVEAAVASLASNDGILLHRAVIGQARRAPDLARDVHDIVRKPWIDGLAAWLRALGLDDDPVWHARQLLVLALRGNRLFAGEQPPSPEQRRRLAERATTIFLDGFTGVMKQDPSHSP
jgi:Transcriptional regulator